MNAGIGLVVCGGQSSRMGADKSRIDYHGQPQSHHMASLLQSFCGEVWLSVNEQQELLYKADQRYPLLTDLPDYRNRGPMAALLTAGIKLPGKSLLVTGCDYPLLQRQEWAAFTDTITASTFAAAFYNEAAGMYEPLLAYYAAGAVRQLIREAADHHYSLQSFLRSCNAGKYRPQQAESLLSVDDPGTAALIKAKIRKEK